MPLGDLDEPGLEVVVDHDVVPVQLEAVLVEHHHLRSVQFSIYEQMLGRNVERLRGGLVFKAHKLLYHSI